MPLSRLVNYVDGNTLTGAQLNAEFDNILNNGASLVTASPFSVTAVQGLAGSMISNIGSFQANGYHLRSTSTPCTLTATSSFSVNTRTVGPVLNGRDQAAVFDSTEVHFYAITTGGMSTKAGGIVSSNPPPTGPTLPAGYTAWAYLASAKYSTGSSSVGGLTFPASDGYQVVGAKVYPVNPYAGLVTGTMGYSLSGATAIGLTSAVPSVATDLTLHVYNYRVQAGSAGSSILAAIAFTLQTGITYRYIYARQSVSTALALSPSFGGEITIPVLTSQGPTCSYTHQFTNGTSAGFEADLVCFTVPNGG